MIRAFLAPYMLPAALTALLGAVALFWWQSARINALTAESAALSLRADACDARTKNLIEDKESDASIDRLDDLTDVPDRWLRP